MALMITTLGMFSLAVTCNYYENGGRFIGVYNIGGRLERHVRRKIHEWQKEKPEPDRNGSGATKAWQKIATPDTLGYVRPPETEEEVRRKIEQHKLRYKSGKKRYRIEYLP